MAGTETLVVEFAFETWQSGEEGRRRRGTGPRLVVAARLGELLRSQRRRSGSRTDMRVGEDGKDSSTNLRGMRMRLGELGLCGRMLL